MLFDDIRLTLIYQYFNKIIYKNRENCVHEYKTQIYVGKIMKQILYVPHKSRMRILIYIKHNVNLLNLSLYYEYE